MLDKLKKKLISRRTETIQAYREFFSTKKGQIILHDLMKVTGFRYPSYKPGHTKSEDMAFNEGRKSVVLQILQTVNASEEQIHKHLQVIQSKEEELNE